jgi:penicillin-binding protein 1A
MLRGVVNGGTGTRIRSQYGIRGDLAGKTGTTQGGADGWFMLLHPDLVMGSWVGFNTPLVRFRTSYWGQGAHNALRIVGSFMQQASLRQASFERPGDYRMPRSRHFRYAGMDTIRALRPKKLVLDTLRFDLPGRPSRSGADLSSNAAAGGAPVHAARGPADSTLAAPLPTTPTGETPALREASLTR